MSYQIKRPEDIEGSGQPYSLRRTQGTEWAAKHLERTYKGYSLDGTKRTMLISPPRLIAILEEAKKKRAFIEIP